MQQQKIRISRFFNVLIEGNFINESDILKTISEQLEIPYLKIDQKTVDHRIANIIPEAFSRQHYVLPLFQLGSVLSIAICNPFELHALEEIETINKITLEPVLTEKSNIESLFNYCYAYHETVGEGEESTTSMSSLFEMGMKLVDDKTGTEGEEEGLDLAQEAPIAKLVDTIIKQAVNDKVSDIHIEPEENVVKIRFRVDGILKDIMAPPKKLESAIISRLKILANLDITETRKPQDGRITVTMKDREVDFRVSTVRTISGEKVVLRVLDKSGAFVSIDRIGLSDDDFKRVNAMITSSSGIVIVCGPTGSGKTSTLYSCLSKINNPDINIITIEDPVEFNLEGINQIPVNQKIGMTFSTGLSAIVRQDPDVIMVGEVRDYDTANIAIQAALTGHVVFTTLHTRNAPGSVARLLDMGVAPFLINSSIVGVMAQRLVRRICNNCKKPQDISTITNFKEVEVLKSVKSKNKGSKTTVYKGEGCQFCDNTGYKGRLGIFEIMILNDEIGELILNKASSAQIKKEAIKNGMHTLLEDGVEKIIGGMTSVEEVARVLDVF